MKWKYSLKNNELLVEDAIKGRAVWLGKPDECPVSAIIPVSNIEDCIVLLDYYFHSKSDKRSLGNLVRCRPDGSVAWRAELPETFDSYVNMAWTDQGLLATSWSGHNVLLDLE